MIKFRSKKEILDEALYSTYYKYAKLHDHGWGTQQTVDALQKYIGNGDPKFFSNVLNGRDEVVRKYNRKDLAIFIAGEYVKKMMTGGIDSDIAAEILFMDETEAVKQLSECLLNHQNRLGNISAKKVSELVCKSYAEKTIEIMKKRDTEIEKRVEARLNKEEPKYGIKNVRVQNRNLVNRCREQILRGEQITYQNQGKRGISYNLNDELLAESNIGLRRMDQQDSVLLLYHPSNPNYKMLVVADGVGGSTDGAKASQEVVRQMIDWFERLNPDILREDNLTTLQSAWTEKLKDINQDIIATNRRDSKTAKDNSASTFVGAIVGENSTMVASLGDSRCYAYGVDDQLHQLTVDDNVEYLAFQARLNNYMRNLGRPLTDEEKQKIAEEKDDLRFQNTSNQITQCLGYYEEIEPKFSTLQNDLYRALMLFSDGVTDCLSDSQILGITRETDKKYLASKLVLAALTTESRRAKRSDPQHRDIITGGKDNTTAAVYINKSNDKGEER